VDTLERTQQSFFKNHGIVEEEQVHHFLRICRQLETLHRKMRQITQRQVLQQIMTAVVASDRDDDGDVSPSEMERLIVRLHALPGVQFHEQIFREQMTQGNRSLSTIMNMLKRIMQNRDNDDDDDAILTLRPQDMVKRKPTTRQQTTGKQRT